MLDLPGLELTDEDRDILHHPLIGGVILFSRNFESILQLQSLIKEIRAASRHRLLLAVDHEGGRVQRFRNGFTAIPAAQSYAALLPTEKAMDAAKMAGWLIAAELTSLDIDLSFSPVLDVGHACPAIGDRAFHHDVDIALKMACAMIDGLHDGGMKVTGKHFPGHGAVKTDSHKAISVDTRECEAIEKDMSIFSELIKRKKLDAVMPAHVIYPAFDARSASGSSFWLKTVLKEKLGFSGVIFSDDLSMEGAKTLGNYAERALASLNAGCNMALICNNRQGAIEAMDLLPPIQVEKPKLLFHTNKFDYNHLINTLHWRKCHSTMERLNEKWQVQQSCRL